MCIYSLVTLNWVSWLARRAWRADSLTWKTRFPFLSYIYLEPAFQSFWEASSSVVPPTAPPHAHTHRQTQVDKRRLSSWGSGIMKALTLTGWSSCFLIQQPHTPVGPHLEVCTHSDAGTQLLVSNHSEIREERLIPLTFWSFGVSF